MYLQHGDPALTGGTWRDGLEQIIATKKDATLQRWQTAKKDPALDSLLARRLLDTTGQPKRTEWNNQHADRADALGHRGKRDNEPVIATWQERR